MAEQEIEVKLRMESAAPLEAAGLSLVVETPRHFEDNWLLDTPGQDLRARGTTLRVRILHLETGVRGLLTLKEKAPASAPATQFKLRMETETTLGEPENMLRVLASLGYWKTFRYQKYRTVYRAQVSAMHSLHVMFDETPLGNFVELEGNETALAAALAKLGVPQTAYILSSYIALQAAACERRGLPLQDMLFSDPT
ncbi:MAG: class IV adenylate cyclase [Blastocatellia bacterium]